MTVVPLGHSLGVGDAIILEQVVREGLSEEGTAEQSQRPSDFYTVVTIHRNDTDNL